MGESWMSLDFPWMEEVEPRLEQRPRATHGAVAEVIARRFSSGVRRSALASVDCASVAGRLPRHDGVNCARRRSEEHTSEIQSLMRISYAVVCLKKKTVKTTN